jgi:hypothetical protein
MARLSPGATQERYQRILAAWKDLAPTATFGGHTLAQLQAMGDIGDDHRATVLEMDNKLSGAIKARDDHDDTIVEALDLIVNGVRADKSVGGSDGALYKQMGFVIRSQRKSPVRKAKAATTPQSSR